MPAALQLESVQFAYGKKPVIHGVDLVLQAGELFGLLGPNGAGKTTLMTLMAGLLKPSQGQVWVVSHDMATAPLVARAQLGLVFQSVSLDRFMTVAENLRFAGGLQGLSVAAVSHRIEALCAALPLKALLGRKVLTLSGGQQRIADIARALLHSPRVLLLDEPTHGLDVMARQQVWNILNDLRRQPDGPAVLVSTHLMDEASGCDRVCFIRDGRVLWSGTPHEALSQLPPKPAVTTVPTQSLADWFVWSMST